MTSALVEEGAEITYRGRTCKVVKVMPHQKLYIEMDGVRQVISFDDVSAADTPPAPIDLSMFSKEKVDEAFRRYNLFDDYFSGKKKLSQVAKDEGAPVSTVHEWFVKRQAEDILRFLPSPRSDKGTFRANPLVKQTVDAETAYDDERAVTTVIRIVRESLKSLAPEIDPDEGPLEVSDATLTRMIKDRRTQKEHNLRNDIPYLPAEHLMHEVHIDHTPSALRLVDQYNYRTVNPVNTHATCGASRYAWAIVGAAGPNATTYGRIFSEITVGRKLAHVVSPIFHAVPHIIYTDNGPDLVSKSAKLTLTVLKVWLKLRPKNAPHFGGIVERTFLNEITSNKRLAAAAELSPREVKALLNRRRLTLEAYTKMYQRYVYDLYNNREHSELRCTPREMVDLLLVGSDHRPGRGSLRVVSAEQREEVKVNFMTADTYKIHNNGVRPLGIPFKNAELMKREGQSVRVRYDPDRRLGHVYVWLEDEKRHLKVPRLHQRYYPPPHLSEVQDARRFLQREAYNQGKPNPILTDDVIDARILVQRELDEAAYAGRATKSRAERAATKRAKQTPFADQEDLNASEQEQPDSGAYEDDLAPNLDVVHSAIMITQPGDEED